MEGELGACDVGTDLERPTLANVVLLASDTTIAVSVTCATSCVDDDTATNELLTGGITASVLQSCSSSDCFSDELRGRALEQNQPPLILRFDILKVETKINIKSRDSIEKSD